MVITVNGRLHSVEASPCFIGDMMHIATVCNLRKARPSDARLIAAAPKLYEALSELIDACGRVGYKDGGTAACYESERHLYDVLDQARAALAEAAS